MSNRKGSHTVSRLNCHLVWVTKYQMVNDYLEHHRKGGAGDSNFILEKE